MLEAADNKKAPNLFNSSSPVANAHNCRRFPFTKNLQFNDIQFASVFLGKEKINHQNGHRATSAVTRRKQ
jgi:hypothetical protein